MLQICQQQRALRLRPGLAHDAMAGDGVLLGRWWLSGAIGNQLGRGEWAEMVLVRVQRGSQGRASMDQPDARMTSAVNPPLVAFGLAKPPFQVQVVARQFLDRTHKQSREKAGHQAGQVLGERILLLGESAAEFLKHIATLFGQALGGIECVGNGLELFHLRTQFRLDFRDGLQPAVDAGR